MARKTSPRMHGPGAAFQRGQIKRGTVPRLIKYILQYYKPHVLTVIICLLLSSVSGVSASVFIKLLIDDCITPGITLGWNAVSGHTVVVLAGWAAVYLVGVFATFAYTRIMATVTQGTLRNLRDAMFAHMQMLPVKYFDTHAHGDIMSNYTNDTDAIRQMIGQSLPHLLTTAVSALALIFVMLSYSIWLFLAALIALFLMFKSAKFCGGRSARFMAAQQKSLAVEEGFVEEMMTGLRVVKVFTHEQKSRETFDELNEQLFHDSSEANSYSNILGPILNNIGNIFYVVIAAVGGVLFFLHIPNLCLRGIEPLTMGIIVTFLGMFRQISQMTMQVSSQIGMVAMGMAGAGRVFDLLDEPTGEDNGFCELVNVKRLPDGTLEETSERTELWAWKYPHPDGVPDYTELKGDIELEEVDFGYVPEKLVLENVTLHAKPGQKFAFVGATGAGKTTITNLINRFYDIPDGKIRYDGINVNKIKKPDLRRSLGIVLQDVNLFTGTVMENIRYGRLNATDEECIEAAKLANAHDFISRLPDGYDTLLTGNGSSLSQGQRQLLSIARAAVADAPAMILDEATSSIDTRTEALVQEGMDRLMQGRTVFVIAHRLSTVKNSDMIIVLDHGHIIEQGNHEELLAKKGTYYQLYTGAFELE